MLSYKYTETDKIGSLLIEAEALKIIFGNLKVLPQVEENFRRESLLKSSLYSARVEGNPARINNIDSQEKIHKLEISNLVSAYKFIYSNRVSRKISVSLLKKLHIFVLKNISGQAGNFRSEPWAIFNQAGVAIFLAPAHFKVPELVDELIYEINNSKQSVFVKSALFQFLLEKIHPFPDGNGRVGRLMSSYILNMNGYGFRGLIPVEEVIDNERDSYYQVLTPDRDATEFVQFFIESFIKQAKNVLEKINKSSEPAKIDLLPLRRQEIIKIIKDHPYCSFDFLSRRFSKVNQKTLHYDIRKLIDAGFVVKIGKTNGVVYRATP